MPMGADDGGGLQGKGRPETDSRSAEGGGQVEGIQLMPRGDTTAHVKDSRGGSVWSGSFPTRFFPYYDQTYNTSKTPCLAMNERARKR